MGGDFGPQVVIPGAAKALDRHPDISFVFYGLKEQCDPVLAKFPKLREKSVFHDCELAVSMEEKPSQALRRGRVSFRVDGGDKPYYAGCCFDLH